MTNLTPARLAELRRITERATPGALRGLSRRECYARQAGVVAEFTAPTCLALLDEIERLRAGLRAALSVRCLDELSVEQFKALRALAAPEGDNA